MSVYDPEESTLSAWGQLVEKQSKGITPEEFICATPPRAFR